MQMLTIQRTRMLLHLYAWASISSDHGQSANRLPELTKRKVEEKAMMDECFLAHLRIGKRDPSFNK